MTGGKTKEIALPTSYEEIRGFAQAFKESGMFADTKSLAQAIVKIQAGRELGLPPVYAMQNINLIRDRLTTSANTMAMLVKRSEKYNYKILSHTDTECLIEFFENGKTVGSSSFTMDDAKRAELIKPGSGWVKFPRAMLFSRAISQGARIYCPDAIGGIYTDEEIRSIPPVEQAPTKSELKSEAPLSSPLGESETLTATSTSETSQPVASQEGSGINSQAGEAKPVKRDISTIRTITDMYKACFTDFKLQPNQVMAELNIKSWSELTLTPAEAYQQVSGARPCHTALRADKKELEAVLNEMVK